ncbi:MAG: SH3 domain-containing protein [Desulfobulbaceae bacterium]|nr:MAG: SH3 domain-containing protein [Desulfobulbaceae bacterium]
MLVFYYTEITLFFCILEVLFPAFDVERFHMAQMNVQVKELLIRDKPSFLGKGVRKVFYGQQLVVTSEAEDWVEVRVSGINGWVHRTALTSKKIILESGAKRAEVTASDDEITIAGKGFNQQIENDFRKKNGSKGFGWVDQAENYTVSSREIAQFLRDGQLAPEGGGS